MKADEYKPTHGGYPDTDEEKYIKIMVEAALRDVDLAFSKLRHQHQRRRDEGQRCGSE